MTYVPMSKNDRDILREVADEITDEMNQRSKRASKRIGKQYKVVLETRKDAGAIIYVWAKASDEDMEAAKKLPHIYTVKGGFLLLSESHFMHAENGRERYRQIRNKNDAVNLAMETI